MRRRPPEALPPKQRTDPPLLDTDAAGELVEKRTGLRFSTTWVQPPIAPGRGGAGHAGNGAK